MKTMIDLTGAETLVTNTKKLIADEIAAHNSDGNAHDGLSGGVQIAIGDTQPVNASLWFDTSEYASIQGETPTQIITISKSDTPIIISDTKPTENNILWLDTSGGD